MENLVHEASAIERTGEWMCKARQILAYGGLDGIVQRPLYYADDGVFPQFAASAQGYELIDSTGQSFVDWVNGWGPVMLGYRRPEVEEAIKSQLSAGPTLSLMHPIEVEVASMLTEMIPCADMVAFGKNGSDVLTAAVRVARAVTNRPIILQYGMHGFHDWYTCVFPELRGIPDVLRSLIHSFPYNDLEPLEKLFKRFKGEVAAVVMEPVREKLPEPGYLEGVKELCKKQGALLIYDEVVTAFRLANGGAQEFYGVIPDLACIGKSMANGMPLSAIVGKREYMQYLPAVGFGMTFRGETLSLAAAQAVLKILREEPVAEHLTRIGNKVRQEFHAACEKTGVRCTLSGPPARMSFMFEGDGGLSLESLRALFLQECLKNGVFTNGNLLASYAHDYTALERTKEGLNTALEVVAEAVRAGRIAEEHPTGGFPFGPRATISTGFLEDFHEEEDGLVVSGWMLLQESAPDSIQFVSASNETCNAKSIKRPDIAKAFPNMDRAKHAGYAAILPREAFTRDGYYDLTICALLDDQVVFRCRVVRRLASDTKGPYWTGDGVLYL